MIRASLTFPLPLALAALVSFSTAHRAAADGHLVAAADVVDRESLKGFVLGARSLVESAGNEDELKTVLEELRTDEWKQGSIYIFITGYDGTSFFHAAVPAREGTNNIDQEDSNGVMVVQELIAAAQSGGGFVEYLWDNPAIDGADESPKVSYAAPVEILGESYYIGAGLYPSAEGTSVAPSSWGRLKEGL